MKESLKQNIIRTFKNLNAVVLSFKESEIDAVPFEGSWTAGQVCEHIIKSISGIPELCNGNTEQTMRMADEKMDAINAMFLDFTIKMQSPPFILPISTNHDRNSIISTLKMIEKAMIGIVETHDLTLVCIDFELPPFGKLTKYEWIGFGLAHTQRHTYQLKNILQNFNP